MTSGAEQDPARLDIRIDEACRLHACAPAVSDEHTTLDYATMAEQSSQLTEEAQKSSLQPNEPVIVALSNHASDFTALFAVWKAGGVAVPVHRRSSAATVTDMLSRTGARFAINAHPNEPLAGLGTSLTSIQQLHDTPPPPREILEDAAWIVFTSGSTGKPKGVVHGHDTYLAKLDAINAAMTQPGSLRVLLPLQLTFAYAQWVSLTAFLRGGEVIIANPFKPDRFAQKLKQDITATAVVPTMLRQLRPLIENKSCDPFAGVLMSGGEPLPAELGLLVRHHWPDALLWDVYGLTETATSDFYVRPQDYDTAAGTIGRPAPGIDFRIALEDSELQIRTPFLMRGYLDAPDLTDMAQCDGYFRTGDQARLREDGTVEITGRLSDIVNRAGNKIAPLELERLFASHPSIVDALATGLPDADQGESLHIAVVPKTGVELEARALRRWAAEKMDRHKLPDAIHVTDSLPTGATGKADRKALRAELMSGVSPKET